MIVEAVRDDGAYLVTDGPAAAVVSDDGVFYTSRLRALSHGEWQRVDDSTDTTAAVAQVNAEHLAAVRAELEDDPV